MIRKYNTSQLSREDTLLKIQYICDEIEAIQKSIDFVEKKVAAIEKPIRWLTKLEAWRLGQSLVKKTAARCGTAAHQTSRTLAVAGQ